MYNDRTPLITMRKLSALALLSPFLLVADDIPRQAIEILATNCSSCHGEAKMSKLDLRTRESMLAGGERGPALEPGDAAKSRLYRFAAHMENPTMPPGKELPDWQLVVLRRWICRATRRGTVPSALSASTAAG